MNNNSLYIYIFFFFVLTVTVHLFLYNFNEHSIVIIMLFLTRLTFSSFYFFIYFYVNFKRINSNMSLEHHKSVQIMKVYLFMMNYPFKEHFHYVVQNFLSSVEHKIRYLYEF